MVGACGLDCFNCPYPDCIAPDDELTEAEKQFSDDLDAEILKSRAAEADEAAPENSYYALHREQILAAAYAKYWSDPEAARTKRREYRKSEAVRRRERTYEREYRKKHPEKHREKMRRYRARKKEEKQGERQNE